MKYKKIKSGTYNEAMMKLRMEYGEDAIPLSHRYVKEGGLFNSKFLAKKVVELTAAIPEKNNLKSKKASRNLIDYTVNDSEKEQKSIKPISAEQSRTPAKSIASAVNDLKKLETRNTDLKKNVTANINTLNLQTRNSISNDSMKKYSDINNSNIEYKKFEKEFDEIKQSLKKLLDEAGGNGFVKPKQEENELIKPYVKMLADNEYDTDEQDFIIEEIKKNVSPEDMKDKFKIEKNLKDLLKSKIVTSGPIKKGMKKKIIMFIGPTGVGKTTTMAKLGAIYALREEYKVSFITIDNYRIAATEQLKKYAGIMKIPIHVINDAKSFKDVIEQEKSEIILIDTSGRSHKNELKISEIKAYADLIEYDFEKILCVSANTKKNDLKEIFKAFGKINFDSVIITKVDESSYIGSVVNVAEKFKKPIAYFTNGQEVPNDISVAEPGKIVDMMINPII